jgi:hypothetical protein
MKIRELMQVTLAGLLLGFLQPEANALVSEPWVIATEPSQLVNGSPVLFRVTAPAELTALQGTWSNRKLFFRFAGACNCWYAIAGVDLNAPAGKYPLRLEGTGKDHASTAFTYDVAVTEKLYPTTALTVAPGFVQPPKRVEPRIEEEQALKKRLFSHISPESYWLGRFASPVETGVSGGFGAARTLNGIKKSQHEGLDFHAPIGTTVRATNAGTVILARGLYYEGNCVVVDHGDGLLTFYMHLSEIRVAEGAKVTRGQILGLSGNTGRVNGPHLHFAVRWQGLYVDPGTLIALHPPSP